MEWFRFCIVALLLLGALFMAVIAVAGVFKFQFILNRMHAAAIIDTMMLLLGMTGVAVSYGLCAATWKVFLILFLVWIASPVSSHMIARLEVMTDKRIEEECEVQKK